MGDSFSLVGYTGFVGSNILAYGGDEITDCYNSKNIENAYGTSPDVLIYAGLRAEKYLANNEPDKDMALIQEAYANIVKIAPKKLVLISTIDVFKDPNGKDEHSNIDTDNLHAYGYNRYILEKKVREEYPDAIIIRLPGLFGKNIKKNFIYDYINVIPFMLKEEKFWELNGISPLDKYYTKLDNGFFRVNQLDDKDKGALKDIFKTLGFSALNFTDSRSVYQFYNLSRLFKDIKTCLNKDISLFHPATEPISAGEVYRFLSDEDFVNELDAKPAYYDYRTVYGDLFGGSEGYISGKDEILKEIKDFVEEVGA